MPAKRGTATIMVERTKKWVLAIAIAIVFNLFVNYGIATFMPGPEQSDYCTDYFKDPYLARPIVQQQNASCPETLVNETAREICSESMHYVEYIYDGQGCAIQEYSRECQIKFDEAREK